MNQKTPSPLVALLPLCLLVGLLTAVIKTFGSAALTGGSQIVLFIASALCIFIGMTFYGVQWKKYEHAISQNIAGVGTATLILLIIGALSGAWMISGVVPTLIYYGVQLIHPAFFPASTCLIASLVSIMTGSSWTTIATIGIALIGIGRAQGFDDAWIAGAIISGAYFGDKMSPLSDTTVLASSITHTPLFSHIRYMMITTVPSMFITLAIFTVMGLTHEAADTQHINAFRQALEETFYISPWLLLVPLCTAVLIAKRAPSLITLFISTLVAIVFACIFQPNLLREIAGENNLFRGAMITLYSSTNINTPDPLLTDLVATRGMQGMMNTVWLILCAMCFGGAMTAGGMLKSLTDVLVKRIRNRVSMVGSTLLSGFFLNVVTADQYISIILTGKIFGNIYADRGYESRLLSRTTEDGVTVTSPLIPWSTCGMTQSTVLNVSTWAYFPYCFFNFISPLMSLFIAALGYKIFKKPAEKNAEPAIE